MRRSSQRLARVVGGQDPAGVAETLRGGAVVTAVNKAVSPWSVTLLMADGVSISGVKCAGWYNPRVNDVVMAALVGNAVVCLGGYAGASQVVTTTLTTSSVTTPGAPLPVAAEPTRVTKFVSPNSGRTWAPSGWRGDTDMKQGGPSAQRAFWFYGTKIATARGAGVIVAATIYVRREGSGGVFGQANVRLGTHTYETQPGSGSVAHGNVRRAGTLGLSRSETFALSTDQVAALNAGAKGLGLEPGSLGTSSPDYIAVSPVGSAYPSGQLALTIET